MTTGQRAQQGAAALLLAELPRRCAQVDEDLGTRGDQGGGGIRTVTSLDPEFGVIPDVFANGQAQPTPFPVDYRVL